MLALRTTYILGLLLVLVSMCFSNALATPKQTIKGTVTDAGSLPVPGASIVVLTGDSVVTGTSCDTEGNFALKLNTELASSLVVRASSVGFSPKSIVLSRSSLQQSLSFQLEPLMSKLGSITVRAPSIATTTRVEMDADHIAKSARNSFIPTNPAAALKQPQISRAGSSHSSQIRVHGTNPVYNLNGLSIGTDPSHYGMFTIIPGPVVREIKFYALGTSSRYRLPSTVELSTLTPFGKDAQANIYLSSIDATGVFAVASSRAYLLGSVRQSVLDRLVRNLDISTDRTTIPPTNFQDIFGSAGYKLSERFQVMVDQYRVRDYLGYNTSGATNSATAINTLQSSNESYVAVHLHGLWKSVLAKTTLAIKDESRRYFAEPADPKQLERLHLDVSERRRTAFGNVEVDVSLGASSVQIGSQGEWDLRRETVLSQRNWNFLPPFANTDNPYIYQDALNQVYDEFTVDVPGWNGSGYVCFAKPFEKFSLESGLRIDHYSRLVNPTQLTFRNRLTFMVGELGELDIFLGTFGNSPLDNILEPYQALVRTNINNLTPVNTRLMSLGFAAGPLKVGVFRKSMYGCPMATPDFDFTPATKEAVDPEFITVRSIGEMEFHGTTVSFEQDQFLRPQLAVYASYAYTRANKIDNSVSIPYELNAPHRFLAQIDYQLTDRFSAGTEVQVRSGYPYSPLRVASPYKEASLYNQNDFSSILAEENSQRFSTHAYISLNANFSFSRGDIFFSLANITNRANPIINSASGLVYDAGILPMLGMRYRF